MHLQKADGEEAQRLCRLQLLISATWKELEDLETHEDWMIERECELTRKYGERKEEQKKGGGADIPERLDDLSEHGAAAGS